MAGSRASSHVASTVGRNLKVARQAAGLTQHGLAVTLGRGDAMSISRWERGEHRPSDENLVRLAAALERDVGWFFSEAESEEAAA